MLSFSFSLVHIWKLTQISLRIVDAPFFILLALAWWVLETMSEKSNYKPEKWKESRKKLLEIFNLKTNRDENEFNSRSSTIPPPTSILIQRKHWACDFEGGEDEKEKS